MLGLCLLALEQDPNSKQAMLLHAMPLRGKTPLAHVHWSILP